MWDFISSKPAIGVFDVNGAFDSHTLPPIIFNAHGYPGWLRLSFGAVLRLHEVAIEMRS
jgi:hypothetical protein